MDPPPSTMPGGGPRGKRIFRKLDRAAIFLLIAGTYTPFLLVSLRGSPGVGAFSALFGSFAEWGRRYSCFSPGGFASRPPLAICLWAGLIVLAIKPLLAEVPHGGLWLLLAGGMCYSVGVVFYLWTRLRYHHAFWHVFSCSEAACATFLAVLLFLLPQTSGA